MCPLVGTWPATQACALTGNQTSDHLVCRPAFSPLSHTSQGCLFLSFKNSAVYPNEDQPSIHNALLDQFYFVCHVWYFIMILFENVGVKVCAQSTFKRSLWGRYNLWLSQDAALGNTGFSVVSSCFVQRGAASKPSPTSRDILHMKSVLFCYGKCEHIQE